MPSPFPGMDPWLEDPQIWPSVHYRLITYLADTLAALLPPRYAASLGERLVIETIRRDILPDVFVTKRPRRRGSGGKGRPAAVLDEPAVVPAQSEPFREPFVEIVVPGRPDR